MKNRYQVLGIVFSAASLVWSLFNALLMVSFCISFETNAYYHFVIEPNGGTSYQPDYARLVILFAPALLCIAAGVILLMCSIRRKKSYVVISLYWFLMAAAALILLFSLWNGAVITKYIIISMICFLLISVFVMLWNKLRKEAFLGVAAAAAVFVIVFQLFMLYEIGFSSFFTICIALPWFPTVPVFPALAAYMMYLGEQSAGVQ